MGRDQGGADAVTGGYVGIAGIPPVEGFTVGWRFNILVWLFVLLAVFTYENLMNSAHGRALKIVRHDRTRAMADGVAVAPLLIGADGRVLFAAAGALGTAQMEALRRLVKAEVEGAQGK